MQRLARRVAWLDRYRRMLALLIGAIAGAAVKWQLTVALGADWPGVHTSALAIIVAFVLWCAVEVGLAWVTAIWETECDRLARTNDLPRAVIVRR